MSYRSLLKVRWHSTFFFHQRFYSPLHREYSPFVQRSVFSPNNTKYLRLGLYLLSRLERVNIVDKPFHNALTRKLTSNSEKNKEVGEKTKTWITTLWPKIKEGIHHYWEGSKLFAQEIKSSSVILYRASKGQELSRRDRILLVRTFNDLLRLIPFSVFVIVPFLEFTLPFFLKIFPNMLPSTFEDKLQKVSFTS